MNQLYLSLYNSDCRPPQTSHRSYLEAIQFTKLRDIETNKNRANIHLHTETQEMILSIFWIIIWPSSHEGAAQSRYHHVSPLSPSVHTWLHCSIVNVLISVCSIQMFFCFLPAGAALHSQPLYSLDELNGPSDRTPHWRNFEKLYSLKQEMGLKFPLMNLFNLTDHLQCKIAALVMTIWCNITLQKWDVNSIAGSELFTKDSSVC